MSTVRVVVAALAVLVNTAHAEDVVPVEAPAEDQDEDEDELPPHLEGPRSVELGDGLSLELPAGMILLERAESRAMLERAGEDGTGVLAMVWLDTPEVPWTLFVVMNDIGHVTDTDADQLDAAGLLASFKSATEAQNPKRLAAGGLELYVDDWSKPPHYDAASRVLSWAVNLHDPDGKILNDFTNVLGRKGYVALNLVAAPADMAAAREQAAAVMASVRFQPGHRYEDFDPSVDKSSGLGLRELVVGGGVLAAVKAGKVGLIAKIVIAFKKFFLFIGLAIYGIFKAIKARLAGRSSDEEAA